MNLLRSSPGSIGRWRAPASVALGLALAAMAGCQPSGPVVPGESGSPTASDSASSAPADPSPLPSISSPAGSPSASARSSAPAPSSSATTTPAGLPRKGVGSVQSKNAAKELADAKVSWFYNWTPRDGGVSVPGVQFVPMVWGPSDVNSAALEAAKKSNSGTLLGFNEPDNGGQSAMTTQQALDLWPQLEATGLRLGSPAVSWGAERSDGWFADFMAGVEKRKLRVDFIAVHIYAENFGPNAVNELSSFLEATYARYHKPIWVTEFAMINFKGPSYPTDARESEYLKQATTLLESKNYIERYAWFALEDADSWKTGLYRTDGTATPWGKEYQSIVSTAPISRGP